MGYAINEFNGSNLLLEELDNTFHCLQMCQNVFNGTVSKKQDKWLLQAQLVLSV